MSEDYLDFKQRFDQLHDLVMSINVSTQEEFKTLLLLIKEVYPYQLEFDYGLLSESEKFNIESIMDRCFVMARNLKSR